MVLMAALPSPIYVVSASTGALRERRVILLTGFEPFEGRSINASWEAARRLNGMVIDGAVVRTERLPVLWRGSARLDRSYIDKYHPLLVVNTGEGGPTLSLEKYAHNRNDAIPDNAGRLPMGRIIVRGAPGELVTHFDLAEMSRLLATKGDESVISDDAGGYLCNFIMFNTYEYLSQTHSHIAALFVHVPPTNSVDRIASISRALIVILYDSMLQMQRHHLS